MADSPPHPETEDEILSAASHRLQSDPQAQSASPPGADLSGTCIHAVNGVELVADSEGVAFWPAERTLLVADLHLEKGSSFARRGMMLPPYDTAITLGRLQRCLQRWQPTRVVALGDSFHDPQAALRLSQDMRETILSMMHGRDWVWVTGNHDPGPPAGLGGTVADEIASGGLILRHEPQVDAEVGEIAGHLHPKAKIVRRGKAVSRSCFAASSRRMILPSFGAYTGGLNVFHKAFDGLFEGRAFHALMRGEGQIYRIAGKDLG